MPPIVTPKAAWRQRPLNHQLRNSYYLNYWVAATSIQVIGIDLHFHNLIHSVCEHSACGTQSGAFWR